MGFLGDYARIFTGVPNRRLREGTGLSLPTVSVSDLNSVHNYTWRLSSIQLPNLERIEAYRIRQGDILVTARGTNLKVALTPERWSGAILTWNLIGIRPTPQLRPEVLLVYLHSRAGRDALNRRVTGSSQLLLTAENLRELEIPIPSLNQQERIANMIQAGEQQYTEALQVAELRKNISHKVALDLIAISPSGAHI